MAGEFLRTDPLSPIPASIQQTGPPISTQQRTASHALRDIVDTLFSGSPGDLVMTLMETHRLTPAELERIKRVLEEHGGSD